MTLRAVSPAKPLIDQRTVSEATVVVLASELPAPTLEARLGVLSAVVRTRIGRVARNAASAATGDRDLATSAGREPSAPAPSLTPPAWHAAEVAYDPARVTLAQLEALSGGWSVAPVTFEVDAASEQKPHLHGARDFHRHMVAVYPDTARRIASTAATRLNGYLAGYGTVAGLDAELSALGLPKSLEVVLRARVHPTLVAPQVDRA